MPTVHSKQDVALMAHLLRRAGFGATLQELDHCLEQGYEATVEALLSPPAPDAVPEDLIRRYHVDQSDLRNHAAGAAYWIYRMVQTPAPLREKMCLFWHRVFATAATKLIQARMVASQLDMFRNHGLGSFQELLLRLSRDPAMMMWLDNQDNHKDSINENYGREILELFSMGRGQLHRGRHQGMRPRLHRLAGGQPRLHVHQNAQQHRAALRLYRLAVRI